MKAKRIRPGLYEFNGWYIRKESHSILSDSPVSCNRRFNNSTRLITWVAYRTLDSESLGDWYLEVRGKCPVGFGEWDSLSEAKDALTEHPKQ